MRLLDEYFWFLKKSVDPSLILYFRHEKLLKGKQNVIDTTF